jgi:Protein of unknown function (DUF1549)/Protein of unknown function (DUF1553)/Planctomycete cytochrome C/Concanavalin A-like lectin/glucanases superfamily
MSQRLHSWWAVLVLTIAGLAPPTRAQTTSSPTPEQLQFFESKVRPLLVENCFECHADKKQKGGLRLDSRDALLKGGKDGLVVVPGHPEQSKLVLAISYKDKDLQMPPENQLSADKVEVLTQWIRMGVPWSASGPVTLTKTSKKRTITDQDRTFWSFQPIKDPAPPAVKDPTWPRGDIDKFILAKLESEGLAPAETAEKITLVRRAYLDLHGLPPTPEQSLDFVNDPSADAWEKLIDKLLASPRYGERWGRIWLDLVRYAESDGYKQDAYRPNSWPYRDYVIKSFNDDKPYDRFVMEQLAGDEIAPDNPNVMVATGYLRHGIYEYNQADVRQQWNAILEDVTDVTSDVVLGLSMGCAKCHDHKFDPILQSDYYRLKAFFSPLLPRNDLPLATPAERAQYEAALAKWEEKTAPIRGRIAELEKSAYESAKKGAIEKFPLDIRALFDKPQNQRTPYEEQLVQLGERQVIEKTTGLTPKLSAKEKAEYDQLRTQLAQSEKDKPKPLMIGLVATDVGAVAPPTSILNDPQNRTFDAGFPIVLPQIGNHSPTPSQNSTGRRTALAKWLTDPSHPLTPRVMANRIWQHHFGRGLVGTSSDYGTLGDRPSHPELLDWLARRFIDSGWSIKSMHRLIMNSAAYRQSSTRAMPEIARTKDPENRWLWKCNGRRLDAEQIRDAMLLASGELKPDMFGPAVDAVQPRRSVYTKMWRNARDPLLDAFDLPDSFSSAADRNRTTTVMQSLMMINGDWPLKRAETMAARLRNMNLKSNDQILEAAWNLAYGRPPTAPERTAATTFLNRNSKDQGQRTKDTSSIDAKPVVKSMPQLGSQAIYIRDARLDDMLRLSSPEGMPTDDFTVEAYVLLESIYDDASVRVIASQWNGKQTSPGWAFGVTSARSKYNPDNLILQLCCDPSKPGGGYEVIASDFKLELHKTYYVAASVRMNETSDAGVTFYLKDITDMDAPLRSATQRHKLTGVYASPSALVIGGRDSNPAQGWDGLIDEVRITRKALAKEELLYNDGSPPKQSVVAHWRFEDQPGIFKDAAGVQRDLVKSAPKSRPDSAADAALTDLCHVLMNSNEFLYLE